MSVSLLAVTVDCADAGKLAGFWAQVLNRATDPDATAEFASSTWSLLPRRRVPSRSKSTRPGQRIEVIRWPGRLRTRRSG